MDCSGGDSAALCRCRATGVVSAMPHSNRNVFDPIAPWRSTLKHAENINGARYEVRRRNDVKVCVQPCPGSLCFDHSVFLLHYCTMPELFCMQAVTVLS
jgi:hypothetical protein